MFVNDVFFEENHKREKRPPIVKSLRNQNEIYSVSECVYRSSTVREKKLIELYLRSRPNSELK